MLLMKQILLSEHKKEIPLSKYVHLRKISFLNSSTASNVSNTDVIARSSCGDTSNSSSANNYSGIEFADIIAELNNITSTFFELTKDKEN